MRHAVTEEQSDRLRTFLASSVPPESELLFQSTHEDLALLLILVKSGGTGFAEQMLVGRDEQGEWMAWTSGNGPGWTATDLERGVGVLTAWDEAPPGASAVVCRFSDDVQIRSDVRSGYWFACRWDIASDITDVAPVGVLPVN